MSDLRFKISGDSAPFIAQLYSATDVLQQQKAIEYSGSCTIFGTTCNAYNSQIHNEISSCSFGMLYPNTCYKIKVTDSIGYSVCSGFTTPVQVGTTTLASKSICLSGYTQSTHGGLNCFGTGNVVFSPALSLGENVTIKLAYSNCCYSRVTNNVSISCKPNGCSNYIPKIDYFTNGASSCEICMNYGDALCYGLSTILQEGGSDFAKISGCSTIKISGFTAVSGFNPIINSNIMTTSLSCIGEVFTTTTVIPSISVYIGSVCVLDCSSTSGQITVCGKLCTSPALELGQSFNLFLATNATSIYGDNTAGPPQEQIVDSGVPYSICATSYATDGNNTCACVCSHIATGAVGYCTPNGCATFYNINSSNISNYTFCVVASSDGVNDDCNFTNCARLDLCSLPSTTGGAFVLSPNQTLYAYSPANSQCGCGGPTQTLHGGVIPL